MGDIILKETVPFTFDEIYAGLVTKFAEKGYDAPYDGSNLAQLITSLAYTTSMLNANTAININETILTLAQKRPNIIQDARLLGYECAKQVSYVYELELKFKNTQLYTISKHSKFEANGNTYYYMGDDIEVDATAGDTITIKVKEGELHTYINEPENLRQVVANLQYFDIPYTNVEQEGIEVFVTYYEIDGILTTRSKFRRSETLLLDTDDDLMKKFIRLDNNEMYTPRIYFVLSGVGFEIPRGALIEMNVLVSKGPDGGMTSLPTSPLDVEILGYTLITKGAVEESNESIKENAPVLHNTASRVVTAGDHAVVCQKHSACKEAFVFGGEDEHPVKLGNIFFSMTPEKATRTFSNNSENTIYTLNELENIENNYLLDEDIYSQTVDSDGNIVDRGIIDTIRVLNLPALEYNIRNPHYILMNFDITVVKYALSTVKKDVRTDLFNVLDTYVKTLEKFETEFFKSNVINLLDDYLTMITGLELDVNFQLMLNSKSLTHEYIDASLTNINPTVNPYLANPIYERPKEYAIHLYLDIPYEEMYENFMLKNPLDLYKTLPYLHCINFYDNKDLTVDFSTYVDDGTKDTRKKEIVFNIKLGSDIVGTYTIHNDRTTYIKIKIYFRDFDDVSAVVHPSITQIPTTILDIHKYVDLIYPSKNFKTLRTSIFKLNKVEIR